MNNDIQHACLVSLNKNAIEQNLVTIKISLFVCLPSQLDKILLSCIAISREVI